MTRLFNEPAAFAQEMIAGFAAANARWVMPVRGGVVRSTKSEEPKVAFVVGGGSGHYPAFGGLVGPGLADGAAMGDLFASPPVSHVYAVARAVEAGRGVLMSFGNYAGDVLNFDEACQRLRREGVDCRTLPVTDDIFSAPPEERHKRRGIAGDLVVFKVAGAAAEAGQDLDAVEDVARRANDRTRSMGVAFTGCTLPGASAPLFEVEPGRMAVGLGIHGEQGIDVTDMPTADGLAELFVDRLFADAPSDLTRPGARVVPILNGLGSVKYEELFVVYGHVHRLLEERGMVVVDPQVGEFCTSFDMAGASLTLFWPDEELEALWLAPAESPGFRRGSVQSALRARDVVADEPVVDEVVPDASAESRAAARRAAAALEAVRSALDAQADALGRIDAVTGDGDHGIGMQRGSRAAAEAAATASDAGAGLGTLLARAAEAWSERAGGTSGVLWSVYLTTVGSRLGDVARPRPSDVAEAVRAATDGLMSFGKAKVGDKTMVDAAVPFADALAAHVAAGESLGDAWAAATDVATAAADATAALMPRMGRARAHGTQAVGVPDPGAVSFGIVVRAVHTVIGAGPAARTEA